jgi:hypothetical protein
MNGRMYSVNFENVSVSAAQDLFEISPADDKPLKIHSIEISQISDVGDAAEEMLRLELIRGYTSSGSGGSAFTPNPLNPNDPAAGFASEINNTTLANTGTAVVLYAAAFNIRAGWMYLPTPECRPVVTQAQATMVLRLMAAPADAVTLSGTMIVEEL